MQDTLLIHGAGRLLHTVHTINPANRAIMATMLQWLMVGTVGGDIGSAFPKWLLRDSRGPAALATSVIGPVHVGVVATVPGGTSSLM